MDSLDAYEDEIVSQLLEGDWKALLPEKTHTNILLWLARHKDKTSVVIRFVFSNPDKKSEDSRYSIYLVCNPALIDGRIPVNTLSFSTEAMPLALPPTLYPKPLYCMAPDLLGKILKKKHESE